MNNLLETCLNQFYKEREKYNEFGIPDNLPLIDDYVKENRLDKTIFEGKTVLFIQHCLAPFIRRIEVMIEHGKCNPEKCWFVDIPYSTNDLIRNEIKKICKKENFAPEFDDALEPYKNAQHKRLLQTLEKIADTDDDLLIVDDGAYTIRILIELGENNDLVKKLCNEKRKISIIEQTTRGHRYFTEEPGFQNYLDFLIKHKISLVSIARSITKKHLESPFMGAAIAFSAVKSLTKFYDHTKQDRILLLGFGPVGKATANAIINQELTKKLDISETNHSLIPEIKKINNSISVLPKINSLNTNTKYDVIIGCTGYSSFGLNNLNLLNDHAALVSGSSATVEFNRVKFLEKLMDPKTGFRLVNKREIKQNGIHSNISLKKDNQSFSFLNAGFPINFDGTTESQPYWTIQMTHCLLLAASQETIKRTEKKQFGFKELNPDDDTWIFQNTLKNLKDYLNKQGINA